MARGPSGCCQRGRNGKWRFQKVPDTCRIYENHGQLSKHDPYGKSGTEVVILVMQTRSIRTDLFGRAANEE